KDVLSEEMLRAQLLEKLGERVILAPMKKLSQHFLGRPVYASAMVLGLAFQKGLLPFNLSDLEGAFKRATPRAEFENNWKAFQMGRMYIESPIEIEEKKNSSRELIIESLKMVRYPWQSENKFEILFSAYESLFKEKFSEIGEDQARRKLHYINGFDMNTLCDCF